MSIRSLILLIGLTFSLFLGERVGSMFLLVFLFISIIIMISEINGLISRFLRKFLLKEKEKEKVSVIDIEAIRNDLNTNTIRW